MPRKSKPKNPASDLTNVLNSAMPLTNYRMLRQNYLYWAERLPILARKALAPFSKQMGQLQALILGADDALSILAGCVNICPECRGGLGGCEECQFTGCREGFGLLAEPVNTDGLRQRWYERMLGVQWWGALDESFKRSNPKDFPKAPRKKSHAQ